MQDAYVSFGSNLGNSEEILVKARSVLASFPYVHKIESSHLYRTTPISTIAQPDFFNAVVKVQVSCGYREFFSGLCEIEKQFGREKKNIEAPRFLDLDLLLFGSQFVEEPDLHIPHPRMLNRAFVLIPLLELISSGMVAFPTREGLLMVQLSDSMKKIEHDPKQKVTRYPDTRWDEEIL